VVAGVDGRPRKMAYETLVCPLHPRSKSQLSVFFTSLFSLIKSIDEAKEEIAELHVFSHAIGAGLFLGYKDPIVSTSRSNAITHAAKLKRKVSYIEAVKTEVGAIQTDDLIIGSLAKDKADYQKK